MVERIKSSGIPPKLAVDLTIRWIPPIFWLTCTLDQQLGFYRL
jgi:hypothetical protein